MPADRGPSGTGHDGEGVPTEREWLEGLACQSSYPHEAHGSCPGLRRPSDPPVAVPGPASVSPAEPPEMDYDYQRLLDLVGRIGTCARKIDLSGRSAEGNRAAYALSAQIAYDAAEVKAILTIRQAAIEGETDGR